MNELMQDITIYHKSNDKFERYNKVASVRNTSIQNRTTTGLTNVDSAIIRIFDVDGFEKTYFVSKNDVIVSKKVEDEISVSAITELRKKYGESNVYQVESIDKFIFNDDSIKDLQHIKIGTI